MFWRLQENVISASDLEALVDFIKHTTRFTQFTKVKEFERAFAEWQGSRYAVFVNSGSSANLLLVNTLKELQGWQPADEIIVPAVTWPTTVTPVMQCGLTPVFVDANVTDLGMDYSEVERKISPRTRGIFVAHVIGFPADVCRLKSIIGDREIALMEDACESQGARLRDRKVGSFGAGGTFSFYWGHHMTSVEGGMLCTDDEDVYKTSVLKRSHGLARELPSEYHADLARRYPDIDFTFLFLSDGLNIRNTEFGAVLGLRQLNRLDDYIATRNANYARFVTACDRYPDDLLVVRSPGVSSFVLPFLFKNVDRKHAFQRAITAAGIESRPLISGNLLRQPFLRHYYRAGEFPNADFLHEHAFYIGNNQFVDAERMAVLEQLMAETLS